MCDSKDVRSNSAEESHNKSMIWNVYEICKPSQCQFLQLPVQSEVNKVIAFICFTGILLIMHVLSVVLTIFEHDTLLGVLLEFFSMAQNKK